MAFKLFQLVRPPLFHTISSVKVKHFTEVYLLCITMY